MRMDRPGVPVRRHDLIHRAVRANAASCPQAPALVYAGGTVSYADLDRRSDDLAWAFDAAGIGPGTIVPVLLPPSALLPIVLLAVLKVGAAYAALDTAWSGSRMHRINQLLPGQVAVVGDNRPARAGRGRALSRPAGPASQDTRSQDRAGRR